MLIHMLCLEVRICEKTSTDGLEACIRRRKEDTRYVAHITRVDLSCQGTMAMDCEHARNMSHRHLICHFLDLDFLEREELGSTRAEEELPL